VVEYYCMGNYVASRGEPCLEGCLDGACLEVKLRDCTDSDGGENYEVKGRTVSDYCRDCTIKNSPKDDYDICLKDSEAYKDNNLVNDENKNTLFEYICDENGYFAGSSYDCPNFCHNGACVDEIPGCTDSDNGRDYFTKGSIIARAGDEQVWDSCHDDFILEEQYCENDIVVELEFVCPNGCVDGACLKRPLIKPNRTDMVIEVPDEIVEDYDCEGCKYNDKCYYLGYRKDGKYCSDENEFVKYKEAKMICDNNFECKSNVCISGECIRGNLIKRILNWFRRLFGEE